MLSLCLQMIEMPQEDSISSCLYCGILLIFVQAVNWIIIDQLIILMTSKRPNHVLISLIVLAAFLITLCNCKRCYEGSVYKDDQCIQCSLLKNTKAKIKWSLFSDNECDCDDGFEWQDTLQKCQSTNLLQLGRHQERSKSKQGISQNRFLQIACSSSTTFMANSVCYNCSSIIGATNTSSTKKSCNCIKGYYWNPALMKCICDNTQNFFIVNGLCIDCFSVDNSNGFANYQGCVCISGFVWVDSTQSCDCPAGYLQINNTCINCSSSQLPSGISIADCTSCNTAKGLGLLNGICIQSPTICPQLSQDGSCICNQTTMAWIVGVGCVCDWNQGYVSLYYLDSYTCGFCTPESDGFCYCGTSQNFYYNGVCTSCTSDPNTYLDSEGNCLCNKGYLWNNVIYPYRCLQVANSCSFSSGNFSFGSSCYSCTILPTTANPGLPSKTGCLLCDPTQGFLLLSTDNSCIFCSFIAFTSGFTLSSGCTCISGYSWNPISITCDKISCAIGTNYNPATKKCDCNTVISIVTNTGCVACSSISNSNGYAVNPSTCGCMSGYTWLNSTNGGICK